ncbi:MAG: alpha/beta hydrolase [Leptospiraceae bacterium]|nr:alpha/beta hydrolase [Leptospiraceae bacterium]MCK6380791.1 alpha/beta hydrolase [Leptospiraceae bacterium]NUM40492.1 alpha/beta hydrolase [Leptospiraceae bacterium]
MKKALLKIRTVYYSTLELIEIFICIIFNISTLVLPKKDLKKNFQILIVPGLFGNRFFYRKLQNYLENEGLSTEIAEFSKFGIQNQVHELSEILKQSPKNLTVIAHNTGGLKTMVLPDESRQKIETFLTLGTPFYGSYIFNFTSIFGFFKKWKYKSEYLQNILNNSLLFNYFYPFSPISDISFPPKKSAEFGQGRDWWFDIPGNYNLVTRSENLRTLMEFLKSIPAFKNIFEKEIRKEAEISHPEKILPRPKHAKKKPQKKIHPTSKKTIKKPFVKKKFGKPIKRKKK